MLHVVNSVYVSDVACNRTEGEKVHFQGRQLCHFIFCLPSQWGPTLTDNNLSRKLAPLLANSFLVEKTLHLKAQSTREANWKSQLYPFVKMVERYGDVLVLSMLRSYFT